MVSGNKRVYIILLSVFLGIFLLMKCSSPDKKAANTPPQFMEFAGSASCVSCHKDIAEKHLHTEHFLSSKPSSEKYIKGNFSEGKNEFHFSAFSSVKMEKSADSIFQTEYLMGEQKQKHPVDIVIGSGRKGQSFLSWKVNSLVQLPVTYFTPESTWSSSPGFNPRTPVFNRVITSRCLECHSTYFQKTSEENKHPEEFSKTNIIYGIDCEKCHGAAKEHVNYHTANPTQTTPKHIVNPASLSRELKIDMCALCHSGRLQKTTPSFSFQPGEKLSDHFTTTNTTQVSDIDVHGNQLGLLSFSKCYTTTDMTCMSCHNVHENEKNKVDIFSQRCLNCHNSTQHVQCKMTSSIGDIINKNCIDCHMPLQPSQSITVFLEEAKTPTAAKLRTHHIKIYKDETQKVLEFLKNIKLK